MGVWFWSMSQFMLFLTLKKIIIFWWMQTKHRQTLLEILPFIRLFKRLSPLRLASMFIVLIISVSSVCSFYIFTCDLFESCVGPGRSTDFPIFGAENPVA